MKVHIHVQGTENINSIWTASCCSPKKERR